MKINIKSLVSITLIVIVVYFLIILLLRSEWLFGNDISKLEYNEFGDYIGGVLNPFLTLLTTVALIILTLKISNRDVNQAKDALQLQSRLTLNQMRHESLNDFHNKVNAYIHNLNDINLIETDKNIVKRAMSSNIKKEIEKNLKEPTNIWLVTLIEITSFRQQEYLFSKLFVDEIFDKKFDDFIKIIEILSLEFKEYKLNTMKNFQIYLDLQSEIMSLIGDFILRDF